MFILEEPYVSNFCIKTLEKNSYSILKTDIVSAENLNFISECDFVQNYKQNLKLYTNSENSIKKIEELLLGDELLDKIKIFKDKVKTRKLLSEIYPEFFYKNVTYDELSSLEADDFKYPLVIKPAVGFLSFGVYTVWSSGELYSVIEKLKLSMKKAKGVFPTNVLNDENFILEEFIEGDEFAVDVYFDSNSKPVILNIFMHPFLDKNDVSDRMYITSSEIISKYLKPFCALFEKIGEYAHLKNFPAHIELRANNEKIIPIEVNPLRFAGWCLCDIAYFAYGINPYEYFMENKKPDWNSIFKNNNGVYAFVMGEVPFDVDKNSIINFDKNKFIKDLNAEILDYREYDFMKKPMFNSCFIKSKSYNDIKHILKINMKDYIEVK